MKLEVRNLTKKYGDFVALDDVSFELTEGIYAVLGLNGAGKSTLINLITDNLIRTSGRVLCDDVDILKLGGRYRDWLGYMPQEQGYYKEFTARSYMYYMARLKGVKRGKIKNRIEELIKEFNLEVICDKKMGELSCGMRQRVILAQTLINDPKIVILDEPTAGLDIKERVHLKDYIKKVAKDKIVIYCTHIVSDVENIADEVILLKNGKLLKKSIVEELYGDLKNGGIDNLEQAFLHYVDR